MYLCCMCVVELEEPEAALEAFQHAKKQADDDNDIEAMAAIGKAIKQLYLKSVARDVLCRRCTCCMVIVI